MTAASTVTTSDWQRVNTALSYRLGEIRLFSIPFQGLSYRRHFSTLEPFARMPEPPLETGQESFVFYPTYPIAFKPSPVMRVGRWIAYTPYTFRNYYVDLKGTCNFEAYLKSFSAKSRSTLQRKIKKFAQASGGEVRWSVHRTPAEIDEFFVHAGPLSAKTYQERLLDSGLPQNSAFRAHAGELAASGGARGFLLFLEGRAVAYVFALCRERIMTYDYVGYDPAVQALSPGTVLQHHILESLFSDGDVDIFDFTEGEGQQKAFFATDERLCAKTYFFSRSLRHAVLASGHHALNGAVEALGAALDRLGLKAAIRKLIRKAA